MAIVIKNPQGDVSQNYNTLAGLSALVGAIQNLQEAGQARQQEALRLLLEQNAGSLEQVAPGDIQRPGFMARLFGVQPTSGGQPVLQVGGQSLAYKPYPKLTREDLVSIGLSTPQTTTSATGETVTTQEPLASLLGQWLDPQTRRLFLQEALKRRRTAAQQRPRGVPAAPSAVLLPHAAAPAGAPAPEPPGLLLDGASDTATPPAQEHAPASPSLPTLGETYPPSQADRLMQRRVAHRPEAATVMTAMGRVLQSDAALIENHMRSLPATRENRAQFLAERHRLLSEGRERYRKFVRDRQRAVRDYPNFVAAVRMARDPEDLEELVRSLQRP